VGVPIKRLADRMKSSDDEGAQDTNFFDKIHNGIRFNMIGKDGDGVEFAKDAQGAVTQFIVHGADNDQKAVRKGDVSQRGVK